MIDIKLLHKDFDAVADMLRRRNIDTLVLEELRSVHQVVKSIKQALEAAQALQNPTGRYWHQRPSTAQLAK